MIENSTPKKYIYIHQRFFKKFIKHIKKKKIRVKINPASIFSNLVHVALWVDVKYLRIQMLRKSQILAPSTTTPPQVN